MAAPQWPEAKDRALLGHRVTRLDGPVKASGRAKYAYDINRPEMLYAKLFASPHAAAKIVDIDLSAAEALPGVKTTWRDESVIGGEAQYQGQVLAAIAAETEELAHDAIRLVKVTYELLPIKINDRDPALAEGRDASKDEGDPDAAFAQADFVHEGEYGLPVVAHCCLEAHGQVAEMRDGDMYIWPSTQNVSRYVDSIAENVEIPASQMHVDCQYMGGGFGSKFRPGRWGIICSILAKQCGRPVKLMLDRDQELMAAGNRPSAFGKVKIGAKEDGTVIALDSLLWGTGGMGGFREPSLPYVFTNIPNWRRIGKRIPTNRGGQEAWRAPGHPQACLFMMSAMEDLAAAMKMDALEFYKINCVHTDKPELYREQLDIAAELIGYKQKAHLRGEGGTGTLRRGLGLGVHMWGGMGHPAKCDVTIHPDGSVETRIGTQDLGTGTRTALAIVVGETLGLPLEAVTVNIGRNAYPEAGASGGSTTIGGISASSRLAATAALNALFEVAAPKLGVAADALEAKGGLIREAAKPANAIAWKDACGLLGPNPITKQGENVPGESQKMGLIDAGVGGCQIADVTVDMETGVVTLNEMVAVQDCGLIVNLKLAESQMHGGLIMGITYALYEESVYDPTTGRMLNADMEFYRIAGLKDIGKLKVHMMTGKGHDERGVIGLGEPPVISPGAAISNAVANACGVRVPELPLTPDRVIAALRKGGVLS